MGAVNLDRIDRKIVAALMADATLSLNRLSELVGLSQTPCWKRIRRLQDSGVIRGRVAIVDAERLGLPLTVFVAITAQDQEIGTAQRLETALAAIPEVMEAWQLAGADHVLRIVARDMADFDRIRQAILTALPLRDLSSSFALRQIKASTVLPVDTSSI